jgi:serine/threonine protein kinase
MASDRLGQQLGNYRLIRLLGQRSFADVYLGEHIYLKTPAAIKILQMRLVRDDMQGFLNEARTIASLTDLAKTSLTHTCCNDWTNNRVLAFVRWPEQRIEPSGKCPEKIRVIYHLVSDSHCTHFLRLISACSQAQLRMIGNTCVVSQSTVLALREVTLFLRRQ